MKYELYADLWFVTNFTMDAAALWVAGRIMKQRMRIKWLLLASFIGTAVSICLFLLLDHYTWYQIIVHLLVNPMMVWICFQSREKKVFLCQWAITYLAVVLLGGLMQWSIFYLGEEKFFIICLVGALLFLGLVEKILGYFHRQKDTVFDLLLVTQEGNLTAKGFFDTGNLLIDPTVGRPVHIIKKEVLKEQLEKEMLLVRLIPFHSLGREHGLLEAVTIEGMYILKEGHPLYLERPVLGLAEEKLFQDDRYDVILNGKSMEI